MKRYKRTAIPTVLALALLAMVSVLVHRAEAGQTRTALLAGGCFWCVESDFEGVPGVIGAVSGFAGGTVANPGYKQVSRGGTGHLEVVQVTYDPEIVSYAQLLHLFFRSIDPTDAGGQFCDRGETYTTAIFVSDPAERALAEAAKAEAGADLGKAIVTTIRDAATFWPADEGHQDYYRKSDLVLTRFGPVTKMTAYKKYRAGCGRDQRVRALWGDAAPFAGGH